MSNVTLKKQKNIIKMMLYLAIILLLGLLFFAVPMFVGQERDHGVRYGAEYIQPKESELCPGDLLEYQVSITRNEPDAVEIIDVWCRVRDGICPSDLLSFRRIPIARPYPRMTFPARRVVPYHRAMVPGSRWEYVHHTHSILGHSVPDWYVVQFTIKDDCSHK